MASDCTKIFIHENWIHANSGDGIALDAGANGGIHAPEISVEYDSSGFVTVHGSIHGAAPFSNYTLEFYISTIGEPEEGALPVLFSGYPYDFENDAAGYADILVYLGQIPVGTYLTCTVTGPEGTSEFSEAVLITV